MSIGVGKGISGCRVSSGLGALEGEGTCIFMPSTYRHLPDLGKPPRLTRVSSSTRRPLASPYLADAATQSAPLFRYQKPKGLLASRCAYAVSFDEGGDLSALPLLPGDRVTET